METSNRKSPKLARAKNFFLTRVLCCGPRKTSRLDIQSPQNFRRLSVKFEGLSPEQEEFLREKAFLDNLPTRAPLPIISTTTSSSASSTYNLHNCTPCTPSTPLVPATRPTATASDTSPATPSPLAFSFASPSAPHLSSHTPSSPLAPQNNHHRFHSQPHLRTALLVRGDQRRSAVGGGGGVGTATTTTTPSPRAHHTYHRFSAINLHLLRCSWNSSHPVSRASLEEEEEEEEEQAAAEEEEDKRRRQIRQDSAQPRWAEEDDGQRCEARGLGGRKRNDVVARKAVLGQQQARRRRPVGAGGDGGEEKRRGRRWADGDEEGFELQAASGAGAPMTTTTPAPAAARGGAKAGSVNSLGRDSEITLDGGSDVEKEFEEEREREKIW